MPRRGRAPSTRKVSECELVDEVERSGRINGTEFTSNAILAGSEVTGARRVLGLLTLPTASVISSIQEWAAPSTAVCAIVC